MLQAREETDKLCLWNQVLFPVLMISNEPRRHATLDENLRNKSLIHTFQLEVEETSSLSGLSENSVVADEQQHPAAQTQDERLNPTKCVPCVGL